MNPGARSNAARPPTRCGRAQWRWARRGTAAQKRALRWVTGPAAAAVAAAPSAGAAWRVAQAPVPTRRSHGQRTRMQELVISTAATAGFTTGATATTGTSRGGGGRNMVPSACKLLNRAPAAPRSAHGTHTSIRGPMGTHASVDRAAQRPPASGSCAFVTRGRPVLHIGSCQVLPAVRDKPTAPARVTLNLFMLSKYSTGLIPGVRPRTEYAPSQRERVIRCWGWFAGPA